MLKNIWLMICLLVISGNFFIMSFGIYQNAVAEKELRLASLDRAINSGLVLALHDIEDSGKADASGDLVINSCKVVYSAKVIDPGSIYFRISAADGKNTLTREYIKNLD
jgi:hypothetical protein